MKRFIRGQTGLKETVTMMDEGKEEIRDFDELIKMLCGLAEHHVYLDDYKILVVEVCPEPFIVMDDKEFERLHKELFGQ